MNMKQDGRSSTTGKRRFMGQAAVAGCMILLFAVIMQVAFLPLNGAIPTVYCSLGIIFCGEGVLYTRWKRADTFSVKESLFPQGISAKRMLLSLILSVIFFGMLSVKEIWNIRQFFFNTFAFAFYMIILFGTIFYTLDYAVTVFQMPVMSVKGESKQSPYICIGPFRFYHIMLPIIAAAILSLAANFPWRPSADALTVYQSVIQQEWSDWHPIGYLLFVRLCILLLAPVTQHPFSVLIIQSFLWLLLMNHAMDRLYTWTASSKAVSVFGLLHLIIGVPILYLGLMYKDVMYAMCMLGFTIEVFHLLHSRESRCSSFVLLAVFSVGLALFRHIGFELVLFVMLLLFLYFVRRRRQDIKKLAVVAAVPIICYVLVSDVCGTRILHMEKNPSYIKYTLPFSIVGKFASEQPDIFTEEEKELLEEIMPLEEWAGGYQSDPYWPDTISRPYGVPGERIERVDAEYGGELLKLNASLLMRNPARYISALLTPTSIIWQISRPASGYEWTIAGYYVPSVHPELAEKNLITTEKALSEWMGNIQYYIMGHPFFSVFFTRGGIWCFSLMFLAGILFLRGQARYLFSLALPLLNMALMMLSCPSQDPRFVLPTLEAALFLLPAIYYLPGDYSRRRGLQEKRK